MKRFIVPAVLGALVGIAVQYLISIIISLKLRLGYLMAYIATLAEAAHGEMNAVMLEAALSAFLGMGVALAITFARQRKWRVRSRCAAAGLSLLVGCLPILPVTLYLLQGLV